MRRQVLSVKLLPPSLSPCCCQRSHHHCTSWSRSRSSNCWHSTSSHAAIVVATAATTTASTSTTFVRGVQEASPQYKNAVRHCATATTSGDFSSGDGGGDGSGRFSVFRLLGLTAALMLGSVTAVVITWPILDTFIMPRLSKRALHNGIDQFRDEFETRQMKQQDLLMTTAMSSSSHMKQLLSLRNLLYGGNWRAGDDCDSSVVDTVHDEEPAIVVLTGAHGSSKSELARTVALASCDGEADDLSQKDRRRPMLYINCRGLVDAATLLHGTLTYTLVPTLGFVGSLVHAYIKLVNAGMDMITMNSGHAHVSHIFFCMYLGHIRHALLTLKDERAKQIDERKRRRIVAAAAAAAASDDDDDGHSDVSSSSLLPVVDDKPLVVLDSIESLIQLQQNSGRNTEIGQMAEILVQMFVRAASDEKICNLLIVADSSTLQSSNASKNSGGGAAAFSSLDDIQRKNIAALATSSGGVSLQPPHFPSSSASSSSSSFALVAFLKQFTPVDANYEHETLATCDLLQAFPTLKNRARFAFASSSSAASTSNNSKHVLFMNKNLLHKILERVRAHTDVPPLLMLSVARFVSVLSRIGASADVMDVTMMLKKMMPATTEEDKGASSSSPRPPPVFSPSPAQIARCLLALEAEGLVHRVAGQSLSLDAPFPGLPDELSEQIDSVLIRPARGVDEVPAFIASDLLASVDPASFFFLGDDEDGAGVGITVDVLVPVRNEQKCFSAASSSSSSSWLKKMFGDKHVLEQLFLGGLPTTCPTALRRVSLSSRDALGAATKPEVVLDKLFLAGGEEKEEPAASGLVNLSTGIVATTRDEIVNEVLTWRDNEIIAPAFLHDCSGSRGAAVTPSSSSSSSSTTGSESHTGQSVASHLILGCVGLVAGVVLQQWRTGR